MVKKFCKGAKTSIKADVIVLGCSLPGIVTANKLKKKFGDTMDIVVLDFAGVSRAMSKCNVAFQQDTIKNNEDENSDDDDTDSTTKADKSGNDENTTKDELDNITQHYLIKYGNEFKIPLPDSILNPTNHRTNLHKVFQYPDGNVIPCGNDFNNYNYLNFLERFELKQYQKVLDKSMKRLFHSQTFWDLRERGILLYYDRTTMEQSICSALLFSTSRDIMRTTVKLVCGAPAHSVSLLFYLHQCYRTNGTKHHVDGKNTKFREKLFGHCRKRLTIQLQASINDITYPVKAIKHIRTHTEADNDQVILETKMGDTTYKCTILAMALKPDQLQTIEVDHNLLPEKEGMITKGLTPGKAKKFLIQYEDNFWAKKGFSGDIFSMRGPILWAVERPRLSFTGSVEKYAAIIGYLMVRDDEHMDDSRDAVVEQLTTIFGWEAGSPVTYRESSLADIYIPQCGDYVALRVLTNQVSPRGLEWGALDIFAEGDVASALEAGHSAYLHLLSCLRPQAQTYEDVSTNEGQTLLDESPLSWWLAHINVLITMKFTAYAAFLFIGFKLARIYLQK